MAVRLLKIAKRHLHSWNLRFDPIWSTIGWGVLGGSSESSIQVIPSEASAEEKRKRKKGRKRFWSQYHRVTDCIKKQNVKIFIWLVKHRNMQIIQLILRKQTKWIWIWLFYKMNCDMTMRPSQRCQGVCEFECVKKPNVLDWNGRQSWISWCYKLSNVNAEPRDVRSDTDSFGFVLVGANGWLWLAKLHFLNTWFREQFRSKFLLVLSDYLLIIMFCEVVFVVAMNCSVLVCLSVWLYVCVCVSGVDA